MDLRDAPEEANFARLRCPEHGLVYVSTSEYRRQMDDPLAVWRCHCGAAATFDDVYFRNYHSDVEDIF